MVPSTRVQNFSEEENDETIRDELDLLEERRTIADLRNQNDKLRIQRYFNKKVRDRSFVPGDLVLRIIKQPTKLQEQWEGPYIVKERTARASYRASGYGRKRITSFLARGKFEEVLCITVHNTLVKKKTKKKQIFGLLWHVGLSSNVQNIIVPNVARTKSIYHYVQRGEKVILWPITAPITAFSSITTRVIYKPTSITGRRAGV